MFSLRKNESLEIAKKLIQTTGLEDSLAILKDKYHASALGPEELLKLVLALSTCNLVRTMKSEFIALEITDEDQQDIIDDYVVESLRRQTLVELKDGADRMEKCQSILDVARELQAFWNNADDPKGPGPRYYCVKEVLRRLGDSMNYDLHDSLFEFMYLQHKHYIDFFREFIKIPRTP
jgi:hypothetical protein